MRADLSVSFTLNGEQQQIRVSARDTLTEVLREHLGLTGTKHGCELGECGACTVLLDGKPVLSCLILAVECGGRTVETVEGMMQGPELHPLQSVFAELGGVQCGYCTSGVLLTAKALLERQPDAMREQIREALSGNLCRCTGYQQIFESVEDAIRQIQQESVQHESAS
ncbi:MAG: (2Fe-2S)-binding protein [Gammaproteobacteria bacterium]|nr:(2Fe-2S)-binding protein [Gammaproteobacteria bacterium]